ncbi:E3 ubiquitin-protein ligase Topors-like [Meleagris gallopavo]|uniref:E3 ubiquitin-protein ligase Topors-like n=1 Tax=Meleagris gallopavo TaxID=9103 RepID=UPI00093D7E12|nr:E3 ubiquitin-protein ligase Topors-like [Meleagris gallopavo]
MAAEEEWVCPICRDERKDIAYAMPCRHEFCLGCILRWGKQQESCPLCRRVMEVVKVAALDDDEDLDFVIWPPATPVPACFQEAVAPIYGRSSPMLSPSPSPSPSPLLLSDEEEDEEAEEAQDEVTEDQDNEEEEEDLMVGGLRPQDWAELFRQHQQILDPVLPWLHQQLRAIFHTHWWPAMAVEGLVMNALCDIGLDGEELVEMTRPALENRAEAFVQELLDNIVRHCGEEAHRLLGLQDSHVPEGREEGPAARGQEDSPVAAPGPTASPEPDLTSGPRVSTACPSIEEETCTAVADVLVCPDHVPAAHSAREAEEPHEEMEQATAAGPSARGSSPSAPGHPPERARRPPKRRADSEQDPQPPYGTTAVAFKQLTAKYVRS